MNAVCDEDILDDYSEIYGSATAQVESRASTSGSKPTYSDQSVIERKGNNHASTTRLGDMYETTPSRHSTRAYHPNTLLANRYNPYPKPVHRKRVPLIDNSPDDSPKPELTQEEGDSITESIESVYSSLFVAGEMKRPRGRPRRRHLEEPQSFQIEGRDDGIRLHPISPSGLIGSLSPPSPSSDCSSEDHHVDSPALDPPPLLRKPGRNPEETTSSGMNHYAQPQGILRPPSKARRRVRRYLKETPSFQVEGRDDGIPLLTNSSSGLPASLSPSQFSTNFSSADRSADSLALNLPDDNTLSKEVNQNPDDKTLSVDQYPQLPNPNWRLLSKLLRRPSRRLEEIISFQLEGAGDGGIPLHPTATPGVFHSHPEESSRTTDSSTVAAENNDTTALPSISNSSELNQYVQLEEHMQCQPSKLRQLEETKSFQIQGRYDGIPLYPPITPAVFRGHLDRSLRTIGSSTFTRPNTIEAPQDNDTRPLPITSTSASASASASTSYTTNATSNIARDLSPFPSTSIWDERGSSSFSENETIDMDAEVPTLPDPMPSASYHSSSEYTLPRPMVHPNYFLESPNGNSNTRIMGPPDDANIGIVPTGPYPSGPNKRRNTAISRSTYLEEEISFQIKGGGGGMPLYPAVNPRVFRDNLDGSSRTTGLGRVTALRDTISMPNTIGLSQYNDTRSPPIPSTSYTANPIINLIRRDSSFPPTSIWNQRNEPNPRLHSPSIRSSTGDYAGSPVLNPPTLPMETDQYTPSQPIVYSGQSLESSNTDSNTRIMAPPGDANIGIESMGPYAIRHFRSRSRPRYLEEEKSFQVDGGDGAIPSQPTPAPVVSRDHPEILTKGIGSRSTSITMGDATALSPKTIDSSQYNNHHPSPIKVRSFTDNTVIDMTRRDADWDPTHSFLDSNEGWDVDAKAQTFPDPILPTSPHFRPSSLSQRHRFVHPSNNRSRRVIESQNNSPFPSTSPLVVGNLPTEGDRPPHHISVPPSLEI